MSVEERVLENGKTRYMARVWDPILKRKASKSFARRRDAETAEAEMRMRVYMGQPLERPKDAVFADFAAEVLEHCTAGESTRKEYKHINGVLSAYIGKKSLRSIAAKDCEKLVGELAAKYAPNTVNKAVIRLRYILRRAIAYGYITVSPAVELTNKPKIRNIREMEILDEDQIKDLLEKAGDYWRPLFTLWLATGLRRSEIFGLDPSCLDVANSRIHVRQQLHGSTIVSFTKNRKTRTIPVSAQIMSIVLAHVENAPHAEGYPVVVFPSKTGRPVNYSDFHRDVFKPLVAKIGRPECGTHALRHTFASQALSQGINLKALQDMLGHADAALTLNRYSHLIPSDSQGAAERMAEFLLREECVALYGHSPFVPVVLGGAA